MPMCVVGADGASSLMTHTNGVTLTDPRLRLRQYAHEYIITLNTIIEHSSVP